uniref:DM10 domain-containing protein n=2 Tax=Clastoptera arizonana TaxID=38151 RepID=A0A1B6C8C7_9HEMI
MTEIGKTDHLSFKAQWYDLESSLLKKFILYFFPSDNTIELFDTKTRKLFLKRTRCEGITAEHIYVGNTIMVFSRQIVINDYANNVTKEQLEHKMQRTFALIKPDGLQNKGNILNILISNHFKIAKLKMVNMTKDDVLEFYSEHKGESFLPFVVDLLVSAPVIALELMGERGLEKLIKLVGPSDPSVAKTKAPSSIRALYGKDTVKNAIHASNTIESADKECNFFFETRCDSPKAIATFTNSTCCIVKPHAFQEGKLGDIIKMIEDNNFTVTGMQLFYLEKVNAEEFLEIYKGVVPEYMDMVQQLISGPCLALEISGQSNDTPIKFRELVGPSDPEIACQIKPKTIRARFGKNKVENAVHVTDLPEDASLEVEYFFKLLCS